MSTKESAKKKFLDNFGWDLLLGSIAAFYVFMVPYTKVEESFNVQAIHDILYHGNHLEKYDHLEFPGVVPRSFIGAFIISILTSPIILAARLLQLPKFYCFLAVRLVLGCLILSTLRFFRIQIRRNFGNQVETFFAIITSVEFHLLFYCTRPLPNILALGLVNLAYGFWLKGSFYETLKCLVFATVVFRCDILLLLGPIGLIFLLAKFISPWKAIKCCICTALLCIGLTIVIDTVMWQYIVWPELKVLWFNSVLNRSSEWGTHAFHWYFTSALPRSLLAAYPLVMELRFIIAAIPMFNLAAAIAAGRIYNNRKKGVWSWLYFILIGSFLVSLGCSVILFMASYDNYPGGYALKALHQMANETNYTEDQSVHIGTFSAMNGVSRFCEHSFPWRYSKEEGIAIEELCHRDFTYLLNEHSRIDGFKCLYAISSFSGVRVQRGFPPILLIKEPKVFIHGNMRDKDTMHSNWPGCS